jgi:hypothetical protein
MLWHYIFIGHILGTDFFRIPFSLFSLPTACPQHPLLHPRSMRSEEEEEKEEEEERGEGGGRRR